MNTTTVRIALPTDRERAMLNLLTPAERLDVLLAAARQKWQEISDVNTEEHEE